MPCGALLLLRLSVIVCFRSIASGLLPSVNHLVAKGGEHGAPDIGRRC